MDHWLDYSNEKFSPKLVDDIKRVLKVLLMFLPMPVFWALVDQIGSGWIFQARRMDGYIGFYTILPDQTQFAHSLFYLSWVPISEYILYPAFNRCKILTTTLQKITFGGVVTALAFIISACLSLALEQTYPILPSAGNGQIRMYNTLPCDVSVSAKFLNSTDFNIAAGGYYRNVDLKLQGNTSFPYAVSSSCASFSGEFVVYEGISVGYFFNNSREVSFVENVAKHDKGLPKIR